MSAIWSVIGSGNKLLKSSSNTKTLSEASMVIYETCVKEISMNMLSLLSRKVQPA